MNVTNSWSRKSRWKKWGHLSSFHVPSELWSLNWLKKCVFLQFCADLSKKSKPINVIYIYASERSCYELSENGIVYHAMIYHFGGIRVWSRRISLNFCWVSIFFDILISWTVAQTPINHIIFWISVIRTLYARCIYVNYFSKLRFLAEVSTRLQKIHFFGQFKDNNSGRKRGH